MTRLNSELESHLKLDVGMIAGFVQANDQEETDLENFYSMADAFARFRIFASLVCFPFEGELLLEECDFIAVHRDDDHLAHLQLERVFALGVLNDHFHVVAFHQNHITVRVVEVQHPPVEGAILILAKSGTLVLW